MINSTELEKNLDNINSGEGRSSSFFCYRKTYTCKATDASVQEDLIGSDGNIGLAIETIIEGGWKLTATGDVRTERNVRSGAQRYLNKREFPCTVDFYGKDHEPRTYLYYLSDGNSVMVDLQYYQIPDRRETDGNYAALMW